MKPYILGNGNTAYILALLLDIDTIYAKCTDTVSQNDMLSNVITIPFSELTETELNILKSKVDYSDCIITKTVGFKYKNALYDKATTSMIKDYLHKQSRKYVDDFSFKQTYDTIDVKKLLSKVKHKIRVLDESNLPKTDSIYLITNSQVNNNNKPITEYICKANNDMMHYSYIYDCDLQSNVKRYDRYTNECLSETEDSIHILNYCDAPVITCNYDIRKNTYSYYLGRYASKTRMLLSDVIKFAIKFKENDYEKF